MTFAARRIAALFIGVAPNGSAFNGGTVTLNSNGSCTGVSYTGEPAWFSPVLAGIGSSYWARTTRTGGTGSVVFSPASGVWYPLSAGQTWSAVGAVGGCNGTFELSTDSAGVTVVMTGTIAVSNAA